MKVFSKGVVLLSGGLDSAVTAWIAKGQCKKLVTLNFDYGQRHSIEIDRANYLTFLLKAEQHITLKLPNVGGSSLLGEGEIPTSGTSKNIPSTWVPQRNALFLTYAAAVAEVVGAEIVYSGVNAIDYSGYPDCRPQFIEAISKSINLASKRSVVDNFPIIIEAPIIELSKRQIIDIGAKLGVPFELTWSCYNGVYPSCGKCDSCRIRRQAFRDSGREDPIEYAPEGE